VSDVLVGGAQVVAALVSAPFLRSRYNRWGAQDDEIAAPMPGDSLVPVPRLGYTRAITVEAPVDAVWPWLVQLGQGRGGLYSFDGLENLVGCGIHSVDRIAPELQRLEPGDLVRMGPEGYPCFRVQIVRPPTDLVLLGADPKPPHAAATADGPGIATWQFSLRPRAGSPSTRVVVRQRLACPRSASLMWHVVEPVAFVMERQMLLGLRRRAERAHRATPTTPTEPTERTEQNRPSSPRR
jgi:hypothetical protein